MHTPTRIHGVKQGLAKRRRSLGSFVFYATQPVVSQKESYSKFVTAQSQESVNDLNFIFKLDLDDLYN